MDLNLNILEGLQMPKVSKKLALKIIAKLPLPKEQKDEIRKGVLQELDAVSKMDSKALQQRLNELEQP
jgi:hypothetical protein